MSEGYSERRHVCRNCETEIRSGSKFCASCGTRTDFSSSEGFQQPETEQHPREQVQHDPREDPKIQGKTRSEWIAFLSEPHQWIASLSEPYQEPLSERQSTFIVALSAREVLVSAIEHVLGHNGSSGTFTVFSKSENSVTFSSYRPPNNFVALGLLVLGLLFYFGVTVDNANVEFNDILNDLLWAMVFLPGILYILVAGRHVYSTVVAIPVANSCRVIISSESELGRDQLISWSSRISPASKADDQSTKEPEN